MNINIKLDDISIGSYNYYRLSSTSYIFEYPCESQSECTFYHITLQKGRYMFELWGGEGGYSGGKGGYSQGILKLNEQTQLQVYIGAKGPEKVLTPGRSEFAYNGGGSGYSINNRRCSGSGDGATDVRIWGSSLYNRIIVAGGGGGGNCDDVNDYNGGAGGVEGNIGTKQNGSDAKGGNQTSPGIGEVEYGTSEDLKTHPGRFGYGGYSSSIKGTCGGGSGAGGAPIYHSGGGGGSDYIHSHNSTKPKGYAHIDSKYYFSSALLADGTQMIPKSTSSGDCEIVHAENGVFKITVISSYFRNKFNVFNISCIFVLMTIFKNLFREISNISNYKGICIDRYMYR